MAKGELKVTTAQRLARNLLREYLAYAEEALSDGKKVRIFKNQRLNAYIMNTGRAEHVIDKRAIHSVVRVLTDGKLSEKDLDDGLVVTLTAE